MTKQTQTHSQTAIQNIDHAISEIASTREELTHALHAAMLANDSERYAELHEKEATAIEYQMDLEKARRILIDVDLEWIRPN